MIEIIDEFLNKKEIDKLYDILWSSDLYLIGIENHINDRNDRRWSLSKQIKKEDKDIDFFNEILDKILNLSILNNEYDCYRNIINAYKSLLL